MRNTLVAVLVFVHFTGTDGGPVWLAPSQVIAVTGIKGRCENTTVFSGYVANSYVETQVHGFCLRETVDQVVDKLTREDGR